MTINDLKVRNFKTTYYTLDRGDFEYIFTVRHYDDSLELWCQRSDYGLDYFIVGYLEHCDVDIRHFIWDRLEDILADYNRFIRNVESSISIVEYE